MSNIKQVQIEARAPWDWASKLPDTEASCFASTFLNFHHGLSIEQLDDGRDRNERGGSTSMVIIQITGAEACSYGYLKRLASALATVGKVTVAEACDIEQGGGWGHLATDVPRPLPCDGCGTLVGPRPADGVDGPGRVMSAVESWAYTHSHKCPIRKEILAD